MPKILKSALSKSLNSQFEVILDQLSDISDQLDRVTTNNSTDKRWKERIQSRLDCALGNLNQTRGLLS